MQQALKILLMHGLPLKRQVSMARLVIDGTVMSVYQNRGYWYGTWREEGKTHARNFGKTDPHLTYPRSYLDKYEHKERKSARPPEAEPRLYCHECGQLLQLGTHKNTKYCKKCRQERYLQRRQRWSKEGGEKTKQRQRSQSA